MQLPELGMIDRFIKIPKQLYSSETKKPFSNCMVCDRYLLEDGTPYMIEKAVKQVQEMKHSEVIFEYAMCMSCSTMMNNSLSTESRERINAYFSQRVNLPKRRQNLLKGKRLSFKKWVSRCVINDTPISRTREYQIVAQCEGKHLLFAYLPFAISMEAMDEISSLMSEKSLGEIDDFMGKYFTGPPEVSEVLKRRPVLI